MSSPQEIPEMVAELVDLTKRYVNEEVVEPGKRLGRVAGMGIGAGLLMSIGALLLSVAAFRFLGNVVLDPDNAWLSATAYIVTAIVMIGIGVGMVSVVSRDREEA
jgi:hypothetical protein